MIVRIKVALRFFALLASSSIASAQDQILEWKELVCLFGKSKGSKDRSPPMRAGVQKLSTTA